MRAKTVGEHDMSVLQDVSEQAIAENLKHRLQAEIIYVSTQVNIVSCHIASIV